MGTPVAGPGPMAKRTDLPNAAYGENKDYQEQQQGAGMATSAGGNMDFGSIFGNPAEGVVGLDQPSAEPGTPVTDGAAEGPGQGLEALPAPEDPSKQTNQAYLIALEVMANMPGSSDSARNLVRQLKSQM